MISVPVPLYASPCTYLRTLPGVCLPEIAQRCRCGMELLASGCPFCEVNGLSNRFAVRTEPTRVEVLTDYDVRVAEGSRFDVGARLSEIKASLPPASAERVPQKKPSPAQIAARKQFAARQRAEKREQKRREKKYQEIDQLPEEILHPALRDTPDNLPFD